MTRKMRVRVWIGIGIAVLLLAALPLLNESWVYRVCTDLDVTSGDIARRSYVLGRMVGESTEETPFSKEVRRLGIATPGGRYWRRMLTQTFRGASHPYYGSLIGDCRMMIMVMDAVKMPDAERAALLKETLAIMQAKNVDTTRLREMMTDLGDQLVQPNEREIAPRATQATSDG